MWVCTQNVQVQMCVCVWGGGGNHSDSILASRKVVLFRRSLNSCNVLRTTRVCWVKASPFYSFMSAIILLAQLNISIYRFALYKCKLLVLLLLLTRVRRKSCGSLAFPSSQCLDIYSLGKEFNV